MRRWEPPAGDKLFVGRVGVLAAIGVCVDAVTGGAGHLKAARGYPDQACSGYSQAIVLLGPDDPLLDRAELHHRFGQLLAARGGQRRQAVDQLRVARDLFASAGAEPFLRRAEADLASHGIAVGRPGSRSPLQLTARARDVAVLVAKGMTNREVAAELYVSPKAVDYHLGHPRHSSFSSPSTRAPMAIAAVSARRSGRSSSTAGFETSFGMTRPQ
jgi:Bacterial regulatory proteins, luxR family